MSGISPASLAWDRTVAPPARSVAQAFADHLNQVLNRTVTDGRLTLLAHKGEPTRFTIAFLRHGEVAALGVHGSPLLLRISQLVNVDGESLHTLAYSYRLELEDDEKESWILRWEYFREPPRPNHPYPLGHLHVNGAFNSPDADALLKKPSPHLHIATGRVPLELVVWHLISDWQVEPKTADWKAVLQPSIEGFEQRRSAI